MNTTQLECFVTVANFLNFSRAAEVLRITQPAVSHQINTLEDELGVKLFHRNSKSVRLTREGYLFVKYADDILDIAQSSKTRLKESQQSQPMRLGVGCRNFMELRMLHKALALLAGEEEKLLPVLRLIPFDSLENLLEDGDIQLLLTYQETAPKKALYRELLRRPVCCVCHESHPLAGYQTLTTQQLHQAGRVAACRPPICPPSIFSAQHQALGSRRHDQVLFCDNFEILYTLIESGIAFAVSADLPQARPPRLRYIPLPEFEPLSFGVAYLPKSLGPIHRRFLSLLEGSLLPPEHSDPV